MNKEVLKEFLRLKKEEVGEEILLIFILLGILIGIFFVILIFGSFVNFVFPSVSDLFCNFGNEVCQTTFDKIFISGIWSIVAILMIFLILSPIYWIKQNWKEAKLNVEFRKNLRDIKND